MRVLAFWLDQPRLRIRMLLGWMSSAHLPDSRFRSARWKNLDRIKPHAVQFARFHIERLPCHAGHGFDYVTKFLNVTNPNSTERRYPLRQIARLERRDSPRTRRMSPKLAHRIV